MPEKSTLIPHSPPFGLTPRSVLIGMIGVTLQCLATPYNDFLVGGTYLAGNHLPIAVIFFLTVLILGVNVVLKKLRHRWVLSPAELTVIWGMMLVASGIPSSGLMRYLVPLLVSPFYFATSENEWADLFHQHLPDWMVVKDPKAVFYFYEKLPDGEAIPWAAWLKPMLAWSGFVLVFFFVTICWCVILRKQWVEHERFTFPLVQLPVDMLRAPQGGDLINRFFKSRAMWVGFAIPVVLHGLRGLHLYLPSTPNPPVFFPIARYFTEKPFSALAWWPSVQFFIYPSVIAVVYLLTLEISFSFWFFFLLAKMETVVIYAAGSKINAGTFHQNQQMGGFLMFIAFIIWLGKRHFKSAFSALFGKTTLDDSNEPLPYAWAAGGLIVGILLLALICTLAGMSFWVAFFILVLFLGLTTVMTWMVANGGLLFVLYAFLPGDYFITLFGSTRVNAPSWTLVVYERVLMFDMREIMMPSIMNNFKIADPIRVKQRSLLGAMGLAIVLAIGVSYYSSLNLIYKRGAVNLQHWTYVTSAMSPFIRLTSILQHPKGIEADRLISFIFGGLVMFGMLWMRHHYLWWKIHPIGYLMTTSYATYCFWSSFFIGWCCKYIVLKFGGVALYRKLRPVFLGIILGECLIGGIWIIVGLITGIGYRLLPG
jgi:hypothetical protein